MANCVFDGGGDGTSWSDGDNWTCGNAPDLSSDDVFIPSGFEVENDNGDDFSIENDRELKISGSLDMDGKKIELKSEGSYLEVTSGGKLTNVGEFLMNSNSEAFFAVASEFDCEHLKVDDGCSLTIDARCNEVTEKLENLSGGGIYGTGCINYTGDPDDYVNDGDGGIFGCDDPDFWRLSFRWWKWFAHYAHRV